LTQEVFVTDIETLLHETSALSADPQLRLQSCKIRFLLSESSSTQKFCGAKALLDCSTIRFHALESKQCSLTLLFDIELLRLHEELLCSTTRGIALLLCRESHLGGSLTSLLSSLLGLELKLLLLLTGRFSGLECTQSHLTLCLTSSLSRLESFQSEIFCRLTCRFVLLLGIHAHLSRTLTRLLTCLLRLKANVRPELTLLEAHASSPLTELLLSLTGCIFLLLSRQTHPGRFLSSLFASLLGLHSELSLLLTRCFLSLERLDTKLTLLQSGSTIRLERSLSLLECALGTTGFNTRQLLPQTLLALRFDEG
jgi:hypothetical protein